MTERHVVTCFLVRSDGRVLLLKRSARVGTYRGVWGAVAGFLEPDMAPEEQARTEVREETGLTADDAALVVTGEPLVVEDAALGRRWIVHPFGFAVANPDLVRLDWESDAGEWVVPAEIVARETVPGLAAAWERVAERNEHERRWSREHGGPTKPRD